MILCPLCFKEIDLDVEYPQLEMIGHFIVTHKIKIDTNRKEVKQFD